VSSFFDSTRVVCILYAHLPVYNKHESLTNR
jgi:hypothetical protein